MQIVGKALLPATSHTDYDESAWMTLSALRRVDPTAAGPAAIEDYVLIRFRPGADVPAARQRLGALGGGQGYFLERAKLPESVVSLGRLRALPLALAIFFGLLAVATVAHALVTTVRRRRHDLAVLRSIGFTKRDARIAIAWQSTLIAIVGLVLGVPLGIVMGRLVWKQLAESFPVAYVPPLTLLGVLLVVPLAILIANLVAAGPAHAATRIRPARVLRTE
jgi:predicted lysophospholipase L1 biosynthesis ABC-type transport system permease subunit